jgi:DNA ligase-associated metallophosphoesterase
MLRSVPARTVDVAPSAGIVVAGTPLVADCEGALYWEREGLLALADLHLEKGSSFARRGVLLPPYDTASTLSRIARLVDRYAPRIVLALGDSFHDDDGPIRLSASDRSTLGAVQRGRDWMWIKGNHDPGAAVNVGGGSGDMIAIGPLTFRHHPTGGAGEIAGHLHPVARVSGRGCAVRRRCYASDGMRLVMPAFGAFAGGLNVRDSAFARVFGTLAFTAFVPGSRRVYSVSTSRCLPD